MKTCNDYVGVTCVNGNCPKIPDEYSEYEYVNPEAAPCKDCWHNKGCEDCAMYENCEERDEIDEQKR